MVQSRRLRAFLWHACASLIVAGATLLLVFGVWYPPPLHKATGVMHIFWIVLGVDVTLGPLLTLVVCSPGKNRQSLLIDLSVIVVAQLSMLGYGLSTVAQGRPAWMVFAVDRFDLVRVSDYDRRQLDQALPQFKTPGWAGPSWAGVVLPPKGKERSDLMWESLKGGFDLPQRPEHYRPLVDSKSDMQARMRSLDDLAAFNDPEAVRRERLHQPDADAWLPLAAPEQSMVVLMRRDTAEVLAIRDLRPWRE